MRVAPSIVCSLILLFNSHVPGVAAKHSPALSAEARRVSRLRPGVDQSDAHRRILERREKPQAASEKPHAATDWRVEPSLALDALCLLNVLSADPFYLRYYGEEYARFEPRLTPAVRAALADLKRKIKDENHNIISAFLTLYFSAADCRTLDDLLRAIGDGSRMRRALRRSPYYSEGGWRLYESVRGDLRAVILFLKSIKFADYWRESVLPRLARKIAEIARDLPKYNVVAEVERLLGRRLASDRLTVYLLNYSQPHGIKITGLRFITDAAYPFSIVLRNAVHESMHPPFDAARDRKLRDALGALRADAFLADKVIHHNPSFGYNSFEGFVEEDCVQALEQIINERLGVAVEAHRRWRESDEGMHVLAVALYVVMKREGFERRGEPFRDFVVRAIRSGALSSGAIKPLYEAFYAPAP